MVEEDGKYYPVMKLRPPLCGHGTRERSDAAEADRTKGGTAAWNRAELRYGKLLLAEKNPILREYLQKEIRIRMQILDRLGDRDTPDVRRRRAELEEELKIAGKGMDFYAV